MSEKSTPPKPVRKAALKPVNARRSMWASMLLHGALLLWLGVLAPLAYRAKEEASLDDYVTQVSMMQLPPEPKEIPPDPPTPKVPELLEEETPLQALTEVAVDASRPEVTPPDPVKAEEPAGAPSWTDVKLKFKPSMALAAAAPSAPAESGGGPASGGQGVIGTGGGLSGTGTGPAFVQVRNPGPGIGTGNGPAIQAPSGNGGVGRRARLKSEINPPYPESKRREGMTATVVLLITVGANGKAVEVKVLTENVGREFIDAAVCAAQCARYEPALENGRPIASNLKLSIRFVLQ